MEDIMNKLKWRYDKKYNQWWVDETVPFSNDGFTIEKDDMGYYLREHPFKGIGRFKLLRAAKKVAHLLRFG